MVVDDNNIYYLQLLSHNWIGSYLYSYRLIVDLCTVDRHGRSGAKSIGVNGTSREEDEIVWGIFRKFDGVRFSG